MASRLTFGIDPGLTGAIVTLIDGEPGPLVDMPVMEGEVDARAVAAFLRQQRDAHPGAVIAVALERIHARLGARNVYRILGHRSGGIPACTFFHWLSTGLSMARGGLVM